MKASNENYFVELSKVNVNEHVEHKGQFSYLSWPFAVSQLRQFDPTATWQVARFNGQPYLNTEAGCFVEVAVCVHGVALSQIHPVLDSKNRPILAPTSFDINTSIQRCLVKAIALHGLGLYIYAGEDLPQGEAPAATDEAATKPKATVSTLHPANAASPAQLRYVEKLIAETGTELNKVLDYFNVKAIVELTSQAASRAIKSLEKTRRAA